MITVITLTHNERYMAPFFIRHYGDMSDRIVVFDNQSTDGTVEYLNQHPKVVIERYNSGGVLRDDINIEIKNTAYHRYPGDWFVIVDFDEFIHHSNLRSYLDQCVYDGVTLPLVSGIQMIGDKAPPLNAPEPLTELIRDGVVDECNFYSKRAIVHRDVDIRYTIGAHTCDPMGRVKPSAAADIKLLHYNWLSLEYGLAKRKRAADQLSNENKANKWGASVSDVKGEKAAYERYKKARIRII